VPEALVAQADLTLGQLLWEIPDDLTLIQQTEPIDFPLSLSAGESWQYEQLFKSEDEQESFGEITGQLVYHPENSSEVFNAQWKHWISIFPRVVADETVALSNDLRDRLICVTNARPQNGHIFLAHHVRYFSDYLNIGIPDRLAAILAREFGLSDQGLPVDTEQYLLFCQELRTFYGIEVLELIAEEYCNESDDRFDPDELREVIPSDVELNV